MKQKQRFTTRYSEGIQARAATGTAGSRYRWVGDAAGDARTRVLAEGEYSEGRGRYTGASVTLYGRGEAVGISRSAGSGSRGGASYLGKDVRGSVRSATDENGTPEGRYEYDAFGKPYKGDLTGGMNLGYTGKPYDTTTGLYNYGYRDYQPEAARFTTADPVRDGNNWFAYVNNDPVNWVDPLGLSASDKAYEAGVEAREAITDAVNTIKGIMDNGIHIGNLNVNISDLGADPLKGKITLTAQKKDSAVSIWSSYDSSNDTGRGAPLTIGGGISFGIIDLSFESAVMDHTFEMKKGTHIFPFDFPELSDINYPD